MISSKRDHRSTDRSTPRGSGRAPKVGARLRAGTEAITGERANALWFFVAFLGGGAGIWWTKSAFADAWIAAMVAAGVVLALMIYYWLNDENAPEEEGDNVYYLGLLFTLISLMFALVELFGADTDAERNAEKIRTLLENFGIALTSTVVGIAGRVWLLNWQRTGSVDVEESAGGTAAPTLPPASVSSQDLERFNRHLLGRIARDLIQGANALARFHRIVRRHASETEEYLRNHSETLQRESTAFKDTLQRNAEIFAQELKSQSESTFDAVGGSLRTAVKQAEALVERLQTAHEAYLVEVREVTRSFHDELRSASSQSLDTLRQSFDAATQRAEALPERLQVAHDGHLAEVRKTTQSFHDELRSASSQSLDALRQSFDAATKRAEALPERLQAAHDGYLADVRKTTQSFHDELRSASSQSLDALRRDFDAAAKQSLLLAQDVTTVHERIGEAFDSLGAGLEHASDASAAFGNSAHQTAKSTTILEGEVNNLRTVLAEVHVGAEAIRGILDVMRERDARIAELSDALTKSVRTTEDETRRAAEALRFLASEAETQTETLRKRQRSGWRFWNRSQ